MQAKHTFAPTAPLLPSISLYPPPFMCKRKIVVVVQPSTSSHICSSSSSSKHSAWPLLQHSKNMSLLLSFPSSEAWSFYPLHSLCLYRSMQERHSERVECRHFLPPSLPLCLTPCTHFIHKTQSKPFSLLLLLHLTPPPPFFFSRYGMIPLLP